MARKRDFGEESIFSYNAGKKRTFSIMLIVFAALVIAFGLYYFFELKDTDYFFVRAANFVFGHIAGNIKDATLLGVMYSSTLGGLFFVFMSMEALYINFLRSGHNAFMLMGIYILGIVIAYTINYFIGLKLNTLSKKLIPAQKFYKVKAAINKYGGLGIFIINVLPLPSQILSAVLGVFKYNKARFYTFFILGQLVKYTAITLGYIYIFK